MSPLMLWQLSAAHLMSWSWRCDKTLMGKQNFVPAMTRSAGS